MAILSSPLFNAQQRLDLEDLNQLISGFRTDARLWVRQLFNTENMIIKGFQCDGSINQTELQVDIISAGSTESATFILAGRRFDSTTGQIVESPSDFSWFTIESSQTNTSGGPAIRMTAEIPTTFRPLRGTTRLYAYVRLLNSQGTPITKAFWDPSANSGAGAEFNQSVNTANDLAIALEVVNAPITNTADLLGRIPLCTLSVDAGGQIRSVVDTRDLFFKKAQDFSFSTNAKLALELTNSLTNVEDILTPMNAVNTIDFRLGEEIFIAQLNGSTPEASTTESNYSVVGGVRLRGKIVASPADTDAVTIQVDDLRDVNRALITTNGPWADNVKARSAVVVGKETGAARMIETLTNRYDIDDKNITSFYKMFQSLQTEIAKIKGTDYWYDAPLGSIHDTLRQVNSVIIGESSNAIYQWLPNNLSITTDPAKDFTIRVTSFGSIAAGTTVTITKVDATTTVVTSSATLNTGSNFIATTSNEVTVRNIANALSRTDSNLRNTIDGDTATISVSINNADDINTVATSNSTNIILGSVEASTGDDIAAIRLFGNAAKFILTRHDGSATPGAINIPQGHVMYVKLPDLDDPNFDDTQTYRYDSVLNFTDTTVEINKDEYNLDATNIPQIGNSFIGRILIIPIERYVDDARNFWIAFHEDSGANNLFVRDIGQIGANELVPIGEGVTNQTLAYIGAPNENTSAPNYLNVSSIVAPTGGGVYTDGSSKSNINTSIVSQGENLTLAVNDLNSVASSIKDHVIQDKDMKIVGGGQLSFTGDSLTSGSTLTFGMDAFINIPGLPNGRNTLGAGSHTFPSSTGTADQVLAVTINRSGNTTNTLTFDAAVDTSTFIPSRDKVVVARRLGRAVYVGVNGSTRIMHGEAGPLDGALSLFGFDPNNLPVQLRISELDNVASGITRGASIADAETSFNISATNNLSQKLNLSITGDDGASRILRFPGASVDFTTGKIHDVDGTPLTRFWLGRSDGADGTNFDRADLDGSSLKREAWYSFSLDFDAIIETAGVDPNSMVNGATTDEIRSEDIGKALARLVVSAGDPAAIGTAVSASFTGSIPIGQVKVTVDTMGAVQSIVSSNIIQLGASGGGGGGGGAGDASQSINNFINRLNLSTYNYFTPFVSSVFSTRAVFDSDRSTSGLALGTSGAPITSNVFLQTSQLIDDEYLNEDVDGIQRVEINAEWSVNSDGEQKIDPNAKWYITKDITDIALNTAITQDAAHAVTAQVDANIDGYINNAGTLIGTNLTNITPSVANGNIIFSENHGLFSGQRVRFSNLGNITIQDPDAGDATGATTTTATDYYVYRVSSQAFSLHRTRLTAESDTTRMVISSTVAPVGIVVTLPAGVLPRIGETNAVEGSHFFSTTSNPATNLNIRLRVVGDSQAGTRGQLNDALLLGFAMFYDQDGADIDSTPRTLDNAAEIFRSNHLPNAITTNAGYGVAGRGPLLEDNDTNNTIRELAFNDGVLSVRASDGTYSAIAARDAEGNLIVP